MKSIHADTRQQDFRLLLCSSVVNNLGSTVLFVALPFYVYQLTGQALATGATFFFLTLPRVLFGSIGGVVVDRSDLKRLMIVTNLASAVVLLPLLIVRSADWVWLVYVVSFLGYSLSQFAAPAEKVVLLGLQGRERIVQANALLTVVGSVVSLLGPPLGGLLLGTAGFSTVVIVDLASFVLAAALIALIRTQFPPPVHSGESARTKLTHLGAIGQEWVDGLRLIGQQQSIQPLFVVSLIAMLEEGVFNSFWVVWVKSILHATPFEFGLLGSAQAVGYIIGGIVFARLGNRLNAPVVGISALLLGVINVAIFNFPILWLTIAFSLLRGVAVIGFFDGTLILLQQRVHDGYIGRILGSFSSVKAVMLLVGTTLSIVVGDHISVVVMLNLASLMWIISGVTMLALSKDELGAKVEIKGEVQELTN